MIKVVCAFFTLPASTTLKLMIHFVFICQLCLQIEGLTVEKGHGSLKIGQKWLH